MKEEENKTKKREEMINELNSDKQKLEQQVAQLKTLLVHKEGKKAAGHLFLSVENPGIKESF